MKRLGVFLLVFGATALFNRAELSSVDEGFIFNTTAALVKKQSFQMDEKLSGRIYSRFSPLPSFFAAPFYAVTDLVIRRPYPVGMKRDWLLFAAGLSSCVLTAWTAVALFGLLRSLNYSEDAAVWSSLLWAFGTLAFPYSSSLFHQVMATLLMVYVVRFALEGRLIGTAITTALLVSIQLTLAATVLPLCLRDRGRPNWRTLFGLAIGILGGFGLHVLTNWLRGDHWLHGAYETEAFTTPTIVGAVGLFFSSGKGLLWFAPLAFLGLMTLVPFAYRRPKIGRPLLFAVTCHCLAVIHWWAWHGSLSWGPRLLLPILPLMFIPIADLIERRSQIPVWEPRLTGSVAALSILINLWAATQPMMGFLNEIQNESMSEWVNIPSFSPLAHPLPAATFVRRLEDSAASTPIQVVGGILLLVGGLLICRWNGIQRNVKPLAPWRAILLTLAALVAPHWWDGPTSKGRQAWLLNSDELHFPIRGVYRLERIGDDKGSISIGAVRLDRNNRSAFIEAPPMSLPVKHTDGGGTLLWTIPGEGEYRVPVPPDYLTSRDQFTERRFVMFLKDYSWLLYLLAVPLYFDWLLGGRRMKETAEIGTEAKT